MNLNSESERLRTFDIWPLGSYPVETTHWARNGFFAANDAEAECNWCHLRIYRYCEEVEERHRSAQPFCRFVVDAQSCGNIRTNLFPNCNQQVAQSIPTSNMSVNASVSYNSSTAAAAIQTSQPVDLLVEANRLATFKNWPNPNISPESLAKAGFFYLNRSDEVKCVWCKGVIAKWEKQDDAFEEHKRFFPDCPRVKLGPLIEMASNGMRDLGIQPVTTPKKPKFSSLDARLRTYSNWPIGDIQRPEALAQAGLYYQNVDDQVRCFHCNIGLRSWQKEDDPWFEHAKWYPHCHFVRLVKSPNYIRQVQDATRQLAQTAGSSGTCPPPPAMGIEEAMQTAPVLQALEIGIDGGSIRNATQRQISNTGQPYGTVEDLVKAIFAKRNEQEDEEDFEDVAREARESVGMEGGASSALIEQEVSRLINSIFNATEREELARRNSDSRLPPPTAATEPAVSQCAITDSVAVAVAGASADVSNAVKSVVDSEQKATTLQCDLSPKRNVSLEEENRKLKDARLCKVCLDEEVGVVFLPCGHLVTCVQCAPGVNQCPMCRTDIKGFVRTYLS